MVGPLEAIPVEVVDHITTFLDVRSILHIRLASRLFAEKISRHVLAHIFSRRNIRLARAPLEEFVYVTSRGRAGCLLRQCTLTGLADYHTDYGSYPKSPVLIRLLTEAFVNIKEDSANSSLVSLSLGVEKLVRPFNERPLKRAQNKVKMNGARHSGYSMSQ